VRKRGLIVLISDFLAPTETIQVQLGQLRALGHEVILLRVLDPAETEFRFQEATIFEDAETGRELYVDPDAIRREYLARFAAHAEVLVQTCRDHGIEFRQLLTNEPMEAALFDFLSARQRFQRFLLKRRPGAGTRGAA
jgi:uncharacterized protein (DUF58 family)